MIDFDEFIKRIKQQLQQNFEVKYRLKEYSSDRHAKYVDEVNSIIADNAKELPSFISKKLVDLTNKDVTFVCGEMHLGLSKIFSKLPNQYQEVATQLISELQRTEASKPQARTSNGDTY